MIHEKHLLLLLRVLKQRAKGGCIFLACVKKSFQFGKNIKCYGFFHDTHTELSVSNYTHLKMRNEGPR